MTGTELMKRQAHIPVDAELTQTLTPRETGLDFEEPAGVSLLDSQLHVYEAHDDKGTSFYVHMGDAALNGAQLYNFLLATAPSDVDPGVRDVVGDWKLLVSPNRHDPLARRLGVMHTKLGEAWETFIEGSYEYITLLQGLGLNAIQARSAMKAYANLDEVDVYAFSLVAENLKRGTLNDLVTAFEPVAEEDQRDMLYANARKKINERLHRSKPITADQTVSRIYNTWSTHSKAKFIEEHFADLSAEDLKRVTDSWYEREAVSSAASERLMQPAISWRRESGARKFMIGQQHLETQERYRICTDGILGALAVAYLSPEVRTQWPQRMGLPGANYQQFMGPAQVPVLTLMFEKQLLERSSLVRALETDV